MTGVDSVLAAHGVNQYYGGSHTLWDIDLEVKAGDCLCLMGRNGVGKTTLLKVIMGLIPATSGKVVFQDAELLRSLAGKHTVVVVEHDMEFVRSIARNVTVLHEGRVLAEGPMDIIQKNPRVIEVYLGT